MTLIEFCYLMRYLLGNPLLLRECIARSMLEHPDYPGHLLCRFQSPDGLCAVYPARALACRLHGNPVMETAGMRYKAHCPHVPAIEDPFDAEDVYSLMDRISELNQGYYSYYTQPYWVAGLSSEVWLTILFSHLEQPIFRLLRKIMDRELALQEMEGCFVQRVRLQEKLLVIDRFQAILPTGNAEVLRPLLHAIQDDFPDTGAYYYFEAEMYLQALQEKLRSFGKAQ
jgi:Fe-S-cluster containining protein